MLPLLARRLAGRCINAPPRFFRHAATDAKTKQSVKSQISKAITNPAPPVLARFPKIYWTVQVLIYASGLTLGWHIFCEYFFTLSLAEGISMTPTMNATGDWLLLSKTYRRGRYVKVGDIISFKHPIDEGTYSVKRVVAMPGDFVLRDSPDTSGAMIQVSWKRRYRRLRQELMEMMQIPDGHCYVVGDNLTWSRDSRMFGPLPLGLVKGRVIAKLSTLDKYEWTNLEDNGLGPAQALEDEDID